MHQTVLSFLRTPLCSYSKGWRAFLFKVVWRRVGNTKINFCLSLRGYLHAQRLHRFRRVLCVIYLLTCASLREKSRCLSLL